MAPAIAKPNPAPHTTSSGLCAPTYTRVTITNDDDDPGHDLPPPGQVRRDQTGDRGDQHRMTRHEALARRRDIAAQVDVRTDRCAGTLPG